MKTIQIPDDIYNELMALSEKMNEQDNRATADPYFFQIRKRERQYVPEGTGDFVEYLDADSDYELYEITAEGIKEYCENKGIPIPKGCEEWDIDKRSEWFEDKGLREVEYSYKEKFVNAFFTSEGCKDHIRRNKHHYPDPETVDFLSHAWRNPEMEIVCSFLKSFKQKEQL